MKFQIKKLETLLCCPTCRAPALTLGQEKMECGRCGESYSLFFDMPVLIRSDSPVLKWYEPKNNVSLLPPSGIKGLLRRFASWLRPAPRLWSIRSQKALEAIVEESRPDADESNVVLIGAGFEAVYRRILKPYKSIMRMGLASRGEVDVLSDVCDIPLVDNGLDLIFSSSVLEHVYDPEQAVGEMFRVLKPGGHVYTEIPFMRAYHMIPVDYQRYTIAGIEELFRRHGFTLVSKGICSGPFTAFVLFTVDFSDGLFSFNKYLRAMVTLFLSVVLHPIKYLDRCFEHSKWAETNACNFYYIGKK